MNSNERYLVVSVNSSKVGYYIFSKFDKLGCPHFVSNIDFTCIHTTFKSYKSKKSAEKMADRIRLYYRKSPQIDTQVITHTEMLTIGCCGDMERLFLSKKVC